jgi:hypothetical protein
MNELQLPGNHENETQSGPKKLSTGTESERLKTLRTELRKDPLFQEAVKAYQTLAEKRCDMEMVKEYVGSAAEYEGGNLGHLVTFGLPRGQEIARRLRVVNRQITKLAKRVAEIREVAGFTTHMVEADAYSVPEELENIASKLSRVCTEGFGEWFPQREAVLDLLELVQRTTGRPHYAEVSALINAELVWQAAVYGGELPDPQFDPDSLKMLFKRHKQRETARLRKQSETRYGVREPDV